MAETVYKIPFKNTPQRFEVSLSGRDFIFINRWSSGMSLWCLTILDAQTQAVLLLNMPIVTGADLLRQFAYLGIPGSLIAFTQGDIDATPTLKNLGAAANLYYVVDHDAIEQTRRFIGYVQPE